MLIPYKPAPILNGPFQPGITDPQWPTEPPADIAPADRERYRFEHAGRINPQKHLTVVTADVVAGNAVELRLLLEALSGFARAEMELTPNRDHVPILEEIEIPKSWRVTITIGLGASLFMSAEGDDRFGIRHHKPRWLREMPKVTGDAYDPATTATDLIFLLASDHPYVNVHLARALCQGNWGKPEVREKRLRVRSLDQGFSRPDRREFLRFDDGIDNLSNARDHELDRFTYVAAGGDEPAWAADGSYLVYRKIRENLPAWETLAHTEEAIVQEQQHIIGREKPSGCPLSRGRTGPGDMTPVYPDPLSEADGPLTAHIRKVQPRRQGRDLMGVADLERRFLRRGYPFFDGLETSGEVSCGLLFLAFMRDLRKQFEWPVLNWQTNPDFPAPGTGIDALYGRGILSNVRGGYYFCPPAPRGPEDYLGSALFR